MQRDPGLEVQEVRSCNAPAVKGAPLQPPLLLVPH